MAYEGNDRQRLTTALPRELFAVTNTLTYLNHAAVGVLPQPTLEALKSFLDAHAASGVLGTFAYERDMPQYRARVGSFIGAQPGEIAILRNTGDGANAIAAGYRWKPGDELILPRNEFPANVQPWLPVRKRGVKVRFIEERLTPDVLKRNITSRTKIVSVSWVSFEDGYRHDLPALAEIAHSAGALFCVDAIQGLGVFPIDVKRCGIDALYAGGAKWLLALQGVSFLYVRSDIIDTLELASPGWRSTADMWDFLEYDQAHVGDATRFEGGTPNFIGALSLAKSIEIIAGAGTEGIGRHVLEVTDHLVEGLVAIRAQISSVRSAAESSGIVTFGFPGIDPVGLGKHLQREGFVTTYRSNGIRVAPHGYNSVEEINALLQSIGAYREVVQCSP